MSGKGKRVNQGLPSANDDELQQMMNIVKSAGVNAEQLRAALEQFVPYDNDDPDRLVTNGEVQIRLEDYQQFWRNQMLRTLDLLLRTKDVELIMVQIDSAAVNCTLRDLPLRVEGLDAKLSAAFTTLIGAARQMGIAEEINRRIGPLVSGRINGIQVMPDDNGKALRRFVAETSNMMGEIALEMETKARQGPTGIDSLTERRAQYGQTYYYDRRKSSTAWTWNDAACQLLNDLDNQTNLDELDGEIQKALKRLKSEKNMLPGPPYP